MSTDQIVHFIEQRPFEPFEFIMSSARTIRVTHPEMAMIERLALFATVWDEESRAELIDVALIESIKTLNPTG